MRNATLWRGNKKGIAMRMVALALIILMILVVLLVFVGKMGFVLGNAIPKLRWG